MSLYYNSDGQLVQFVQSMPPYPQPLPQGPVMDATAYPNQQPTPPGQMQTGLDNYSPGQSGPRRSHRLRNRAEATPPYRERKSMTRKVAEGVLIGAAGTVVLSEIEKHRRTTPRSSTSTSSDGGDGGGGGGMGMNELIEGGLAAGAIALALYEKNRKGKETGSQSHNSGVGDPRMKTLVEGALATAAAVALAFHENNKAEGTEKAVGSI
jgi:hypothetical protein